ncbi:hypothetical protein GCM10027440_39740 [Nocardiopsis coralliicola]
MTVARERLHSTGADSAIRAPPLPAEAPAASRRFGPGRRRAVSPGPGRSSSGSGPPAASVCPLCRWTGCSARPGAADGRGGEAGCERGRPVLPEPARDARDRPGFHLRELSVHGLNEEFVTFQLCVQALTARGRQV